MTHRVKNYGRKILSANYVTKFWIQSQHCLFSQVFGLEAWLPFYLPIYLFIAPAGILPILKIPRMHPCSPRV